jgi:hypothetical protein
VVVLTPCLCVSVVDLEFRNWGSEWHAENVSKSGCLQANIGVYGMVVKMNGDSQHE